MTLPGARAGLAVALSVLVDAAPAAATTITIDADAFAVGTNLSTAFPGVVLSAVGGGFGAGPSIFAVNPATQSEPFAASTGSLVFGTNSPTFPHLFREPGFLSLRIDFPIPIDWIAIDWIRNTPGAVGQLQVYDASNVLIASYLTGGSDSAPPVETMTLNFSRFDVAYAVASSTSGSWTGGFDNLQINPVPEPSAMLLVGTGFVAMLCLRRKRRR